MFFRTGVLAIVLALVAGFGGGDDAQSMALAESQGLEIEMTDLSWSSFWHDVKTIAVSAVKTFADLTKSELSSFFDVSKCFIPLLDVATSSSWLKSCEYVLKDFISTVECVANIGQCVSKIAFALYDKCKDATSEAGCFTGVGLFVVANVAIAVATGGSSAAADAGAGAAEGAAEGGAAGDGLRPPPGSFSDAGDAGVLQKTFTAGDNLDVIVEKIANDRRFTEVFKSTDVSPDFKTVAYHYIEWTEGGLSSEEIADNVQRMANQWFDVKSESFLDNLNDDISDDGTERDLDNLYMKMFSHDIDISTFGADPNTVKTMGFFEDLGRHLDV